MGRLGISYEEIAEAADALLKHGQNPTMESVRQYLGGTGSFTTISKHLNTWRSERLMSAAKNKPEKVFPPDEVRRAVNDVWEKLNYQAFEKFEQFKKEAEETISKLFTEKEQLQQELNFAQESLENAQIKINHLSADFTLLKKEAIEERKLRAVAEAYLQQYEKQIANISSAKEAHVLDLQRSFESHLIEWKTRYELIDQNYRKDIHQLTALLENQRTAFLVKVDELKTAKEQAEKSLAKSESELKQKLSFLSRINEELKSLEVENKVLRQQNKELEQIQRVQEKKLEALITELQLKEDFNKEFKFHMQAFENRLKKFVYLKDDNLNKE